MNLQYFHIYRASISLQQIYWLRVYFHVFSGHWKPNFKAQITCGDVNYQSCDTVPCFLPAYCRPLFTFWRSQNTPISSKPIAYSWPYWLPQTWNDTTYLKSYFFTLNEVCGDLFGVWSHHNKPTWRRGHTLCTMNIQWGQRDFLGPISGKIQLSCPQIWQPTTATS